MIEVNNRAAGQRRPIPADYMDAARQRLRELGALPAAETLMTRQSAERDALRRAIEFSFQRGEIEAGEFNAARAELEAPSEGAIDVPAADPLALSIVWLRAQLEGCNKRLAVVEKREGELAKALTMAREGASAEATMIKAELVGRLQAIEGNAASAALVAPRLANLERAVEQLVTNLSAPDGICDRLDMLHGRVQATEAGLRELNGTMEGVVAEHDVLMKTPEAIERELEITARQALTPAELDEFEGKGKLLLVELDEASEPRGIRADTGQPRS